METSFFSNLQPILTGFALVATIFMAGRHLLNAAYASAMAVVVVGVVGLGVINGPDTLMNVAGAGADALQRVLTAVFNAA